MIKVRAHTCYLGHTGYAAHAREFFRALSSHVDLRVRNYTWDSNPEYLDERDFSVIDSITLQTSRGKEETFPIQHSFSQFPWKHNLNEDFKPEVDIVLVDAKHLYFYEEYTSPVKIAFTVWESTEIEHDFFQQLLKFDYLWVVTQWHKEMAIKQGYPAYRIFVVNEGVNDIFCDDDISPLPEDYDTEALNFMFFGRWDYRKSVPEILKAFQKAFPNKENVNLILSADNPFAVDGMNTTEERLAHWEIQDTRIKIKHFLNREDYVSYIKNGDLLITCARSEGWNIPLIEAMAAGTPVTYSEWGAQLEFAGGRGNPVRIATELPVSNGAHMSFSKVPGKYAEPDFDHLVEVLRDCFENYSEKKSKAVQEAAEIREHFNWKTIGNQGFSALLKVVSSGIEKASKTSSVVLLSHADTLEKQRILRRSLISLKRQGYFVILSTHIKVPDDIFVLADYVISETDNPVIYAEEFAKYSNSSPIFYMNHPGYELVYSFDYNHSYAAFRLVLNGLGISDLLGFENTHLVNYDYVIEDESLLPTHEEWLKEQDIVSYQWPWKESFAVSSGFFSAKTKKTLETLRKINSKEEFFRYPEQIIFEAFLTSIFEEENFTVKLFPFSEISSKNYINCVIIPTYPQIDTKNGKAFVYLCVDNNTGKHYVGAIGSSDEPLEIEIDYKKNVASYTAPSHEMSFVEIAPQMLSEGFRVKVPEYGIVYNYDNFTRKASCGIKNPSLIKPFISKKIPQDYYFNLHFVNGPFLEIRGNSESTFAVKFIDSKTDKVHYQTTLECNTWARCSIKYYVDWKIEIENLETGQLHVEKFNPEGKNVLISLDSRALGDTLAWFPHVEEFRKKRNCNIFVSTFRNELLEKQYPYLTFVPPGTVVNNLYATYLIGWFYKDGKYDTEYHPRDFKNLPLQQTTTDILGLPHFALKPQLSLARTESPLQEPYVCFAIHSTTQAKYWNNPTGWQELTDYFRSKGRKVVILSREEDGYMGNSHPKGADWLGGESPFEKLISYLQHAEMFIGIGSGLSWLSWAVGTPTVIISGFSLPHSEIFDDNILRIFNPEVCNGCFNRHRLDAGDWNWCPDQKGTPRQFECTKSITADSVIQKIESYKKNSTQKNVEKILQESIDLGMVQNYSEIFQAAEFYKSLKAKNFMEIGTDQGGTFAIWSKLSGEDGIRISVDLPYGPYGVSTYNVDTRDQYLKSLGNNVHTIHGSSHEIHIKEQVKNLLGETLLDFLFIDGDHTYEGVKQDYEMYEEFVKPGGWIGFHDIKDTEFHRNANCGVDILWKEIGENGVSFVDHTSNFGGIGFVQKSK
jgi:autotransporter strand-loop-strand O-heptosyltransferase